MHPQADSAPPGGIPHLSMKASPRQSAHQRSLFAWAHVCKRTAATSIPAPQLPAHPSPAQTLAGLAGDSCRKRSIACRQCTRPATRRAGCNLGAPAQGGAPHNPQMRQAQGNENFGPGDGTTHAAQQPSMKSRAPTRRPKQTGPPALHGGLGPRSWLAHISRSSHMPQEPRSRATWHCSAGPRACAPRIH